MTKKLAFLVFCYFLLPLIIVVSISDAVITKSEIN